MNSFDPRITVATIVENDGKLLLVREHSNGKLVLNQPAGHVEAGESLTQAAFRETLEETAWQVEVTDFLGTYIFQPTRGSGVYYRFCFVAKPIRFDDKQKLDRDIAEALWLSRDDIAAQQKVHRSPLVAQCVDDYFSGRRLPLESIYQHPWPLQKR